MMRTRIDKVANPRSGDKWRWAEHTGTGNKSPDRYLEVITSPTRYTEAFGHPVPISMSNLKVYLMWKDENFTGAQGLDSRNIFKITDDYYPTSEPGYEHELRLVRCFSLACILLSRGHLDLVLELLTELEL